MKLYHGTDGVSAALIQAYGLKRGSYLTTSRRWAVRAAAQRAREAETRGVVLSVSVTADDIRWTYIGEARTEVVLYPQFLCYVSADSGPEFIKDVSDASRFSMRLCD